MVKKEERLKDLIPFVFRVHGRAGPGKGKPNWLASPRASGMRWDLTSPQAIAKSYNALLSKAQEDPMVKMISPIAIRTMAKGDLHHRKYRPLRPRLR